MIREKEVISNIMADKTDYKAKIAARKAGDETDYIGKLMRQRMARSVSRNLSAVYQKLFDANVSESAGKLLH